MAKFKNSFALEGTQIATQITPILKDSISSVTYSQLSRLIQLYIRDTFQNGFNPYLAFRIIVLYCYCSPQTEIQNRSQTHKFQLKTQINRLLTHHLNDKSLQSIRHCLDLLMIEELKVKLSPIHYKLAKIRILSCLNKYYCNNKKAIQRKKSTQILRQICREALKCQKTGLNQEICCQILDILIELQQRELSIKFKKGNKYEALDFVNNIIRYLQNTQFSSSIQKYQQKLMQSYWHCAILHYQLHYLAYTKKYCQIVINIAERLQNQKQIKKSAEDLLQKATL